MTNNDAWTDLTNYIISKGYTVDQWKRKKVQIEAAMLALASQLKSEEKQKEVI